jgi:hypothetical protein
MSYRTMALVAASLLFATQCYAETTTVNTSRSNSYKQTKQTGAVARGPRGGVASVGRTTVVRPDKGSVQLNPQPEPPGKTK